VPRSARQRAVLHAMLCGRLALPDGVLNEMLPYCPDRHPGTKFTVWDYSIDPVSAARILPPLRQVFRPARAPSIVQSRARTGSQAWMEKPLGRSLQRSKTLPHSHNPTRPRQEHGQHWSDCEGIHRPESPPRAPAGRKASPRETQRRQPLQRKRLTIPILCRTQC
jgi:hypothetical protein